MQEISTGAGIFARKTLICCAVISLVGLATFRLEDEAQGFVENTEIPMKYRSSALPSGSPPLGVESEGKEENPEEASVPLREFSAMPGNVCENRENTKPMIGTFVWYAGVESASGQGLASDLEGPRLTYTFLNGYLRLSWALNVNGFVLEESHGLETSTWNPTLAPIVDTDSEHTVTVSTDGFRFFRLHQSLSEAAESETRP